MSDVTRVRRDSFEREAAESALRVQLRCHHHRTLYVPNAFPRSAVSFTVSLAGIFGSSNTLNLFSPLASLIPVSILEISSASSGGVSLRLLLLPFAVGVLSGLVPPFVPLGPCVGVFHVPPPFPPGLVVQDLIPRDEWALRPNPNPSAPGCAVGSWPNGTTCC